MENNDWINKEINFWRKNFLGNNGTKTDRYKIIIDTFLSLPCEEMMKKGPFAAYKKIVEFEFSD